MTRMQESARKHHIYYGWVIVIVVALASFTQSAETYPVMSVFLKPMTEEFGWSRSLFTGSLTIGTLLGGLIAIVAGRFIDRFGARWLLTAAFAIVGLALFLLAFIDNLTQFYILQIIGRSLAMGVIALALRTVIPKWFVVKRGKAVALSGLGIRLGNAITPLYIQALVGVGGWRLATAASGIAVWVLSLLPIAIFFRRRPEDMGLLPDGITSKELNHRQKWITDTSQAETAQLEVSFSLSQVLRFPSFYLLAASFTLGFLVGPSLAFHMIPYLTDQEISASTAVFVVAVWSGSAALGSLALGYFLDRFSSRIILAVDFLLIAIGIVALLAVHSAPTAILWGVYIGLVHGGMLVLQDVIFANYYGRESIGTIRGVVWPVQMITNAGGPLSAAIVYDATQSYVAIFLAFGIFSLCAAVCAFLAHPPAAQAAAASTTIGPGNHSIKPRRL